MSIIPKNQKSPRSNHLRWVALFFQTFYVFGCYYSYDNPQALQSRLMDPPINLSSFQFDLLYSVYSFPNMVLPLLGGFFIDYFGIRLGIGVFSFVIIVGHALFTFGVYQASFLLMIFGRLIYALTGENVSVSQVAIISKWFKEKELAFAFGISFIGCRLGSTANSILTPRIATLTDSTWFPCFIGVITCAVSFILALGAIWMDYKADKFEGKLNQQDSGDASSQIALSDLKTFNILFWLILINSVLIYSVLTTFLSNANDFLVAQYNVEATEAGNLVSIIYTVSMFASPVIGFFIDRIGRRILLINLAALMLIVSLLAFMFIPSNKAIITIIIILSLLLFGTGYAIYTSTIWACIPLVVEERMLGTAYGIATAFQNGIGALVLMVVGKIEDMTMSQSGYSWTTVSLIVLASMGLVTGVLLKGLNTKRCGKLELPSVVEEDLDGAKTEDLLSPEDHLNKTQRVN